MEVDFDPEKTLKEMTDESLSGLEALCYSHREQVEAQREAAEQLGSDSDASVGQRGRSGGRHISESDPEDSDAEAEFLVGDDEDFDPPLFTKGAHVMVESRGPGIITQVHDVGSAHGYDVMFDFGGKAKKIKESCITEFDVDTKPPKRQAATKKAAVVEYESEDDDQDEDEVFIPSPPKKRRAKSYKTGAARPARGKHTAGNRPAKRQASKQAMPGPKKKRKPGPPKGRGPVIPGSLTGADLPLVTGITLGKRTAKTRCQVKGCDSKVTGIYRQATLMSLCRTHREAVIQCNPILKKQMQDIQILRSLDKAQYESQSAAQHRKLVGVTDETHRQYLDVTNEKQNARNSTSEGKRKKSVREKKYATSARGQAKSRIRTAKYDERNRTSKRARDNARNKAKRDEDPEAYRERRREDYHSRVNKQRRAKKKEDSANARATEAGVTTLTEARRLVPRILQNMTVSVIHVKGQKQYSLNAYALSLLSVFCIWATGRDPDTSKEFANWITYDSCPLKKPNGASFTHAEAVAILGFQRTLEHIRESESRVECSNFELASHNEFSRDTEGAAKNRGWSNDGHGGCGAITGNDCKVGFTWSSKILRLLAAKDPIVIDTRKTEPDPTWKQRPGMYNRSRPVRWVAPEKCPTFIDDFFAKKIESLLSDVKAEPEKHPRVSIVVSDYMKE